MRVDYYLFGIFLKLQICKKDFLITRMGASKLYAERIRTRIIQAVGRCSRNPSDYSIVCVIGDTIQNDLTKQGKNQTIRTRIESRNSIWIRKFNGLLKCR